MTIQHFFLPLRCLRFAIIFSKSHPKKRELPTDWVDLEAQKISLYTKKDTPAAYCNSVHQNHKVQLRSDRYTHIYQS